MALAASADTITAAVSARRSNTLTGNNSCVTRTRCTATGADTAHRPIRPRNCRCRARPDPPAHPTRRAAQFTGRQPALDLIDICFYGDHCASKRTQVALP
ncbi:hypothetical protein I552_7654 [Mycobacterium xenopi 3993]|nr:hypothetical protein I552_7654 [Mycobacterium xenopi 3993]